MLLLTYMVTFRGVRFFVQKPFRTKEINLYTNTGDISYMDFVSELVLEFLHTQIEELS